MTVPSRHCHERLRIHRKTAETEIELELILDGSGQVAGRHRRRLLRPHADAAGQARGHGSRPSRPPAICTSISTTRSRTWASAWARPCARPWATRPASAATATSRCPWKRRWPPRRSIWAAGRIFVFQAEFPTPKIGEFDSELVADFWHALATNALCNLHVHRALRPQQPPHRRGDLQGHGPGAADGRRARPPFARRAQHEGHAVSPCVPPTMVGGAGVRALRIDNWVCTACDISPAVCHLSPEFGGENPPLRR